jgi:hypothetical protein
VFDGLIYNLHLESDQHERTLILTTAESLEKAETKAKELKQKNIIHEIIIKDKS